MAELTQPPESEHEFEKIGMGVPSSFWGIILRVMGSLFWDFSWLIFSVGFLNALYYRPLLFAFSRVPELLNNRLARSPSQYCEILL